MEHTKSESIPGILVSPDFRKALDSLEWSFMMKAIDSKAIFTIEWFKKGILSIQDLLDNTGQLMSYQEFLRNKYSCKSNFLQYYQVISAIPKHLLAKAKSTRPINKLRYILIATLVFN